MEMADCNLVNFQYRLTFQVVSARREKKKSIFMAVLYLFSLCKF